MLAKSRCAGVFRSWRPEASGPRGICGQAQNDPRRRSPRRPKDALGVDGFDNRGGFDGAARDIRTAEPLVRSQGIVLAVVVGHIVADPAFAESRVWVVSILQVVCMRREVPCLLNMTSSA